MERLGYDSYGAHGNDAGGYRRPHTGTPRPRSRDRGACQPDLLLSSGDPAEFEGLTQEELQYLEFLQGFVERAVHDKLQEAQPQTIAHALADSPTVWLAWSGQLFEEAALSPDEF